MRALPVIAITLSLAILSACEPAAAPAPEPVEVSQPSAPVAAKPATASDLAAWTGKWTGPEGLFVAIADKGAGKVSLEMQSDLDTKGTYEGNVTPAGIEFTRDGKTLVLRKGSGADTGLKWLADKKDCLFVASGEGYCRD